MSHYRRSFRPALECLETRDNPSGLSGITVPVLSPPSAGAPALPNGIYHGSLGGSLAVTSSLNGNQLVENVTVTDALGREFSESGVFTVNYRTDTLSGTITVGGPAGQLAVGTLTLDWLTGTLSGSFTASGPTGQQVTGTFSAVVQVNACSETMQVNLPSGLWVCETVSITQNSDGTLGVTLAFTGPGGNTAGGSFDLP